MSEESLLPLQRALRRVVNALVRLLIRQGVTLPQMIEILKRSFVEESDRALRAEGESTTVSRISVVSGLHRKEVKRLLALPAESEPPPQKVSLTARLLSLWLGDPAFTDEQQQPRPLKRATVDGVAGFDDLVRQVSVDIRPRVVLDEWLQRGLIVIDSSERLVLQPEAIYPAKDQQEKLYYFGRHTADHIASCDYNIHSSGHTLPERALFFDRLSAESLDQMEQSCRNWSHRVLAQLNREALALAERDDAAGRAEGRFTLGIYFYRESEHYDD